MSLGITALDQKYHTEFGNRLRAARVLRGMSITDLAEAIKVSYENVEHYEKGSDSMPFLTAWRATRVLDVPFGFFTIAYDNNRIAGGQAGERFSEKDGVAAEKRPMLHPKIDMAFQNLQKAVADVLEGETDEGGEEPSSVPLEKPDGEPPS